MTKSDEIGLRINDLEGSVGERVTQTGHVDAIPINILQQKNAPYFETRLTHVMLQRPERVSIPISFIQEHGDKFHTVVTLKGPNQTLRNVLLKVRINSNGQCRVYFTNGWRDFAKENGFRVGDQLMFCLTGRSRFDVLIYRELCEEVGLHEFTSSNPSFRKDEETPHGSSGIAVKSTRGNAPTPSTVTTNQQIILYHYQKNVNPTDVPASSLGSGTSECAPQDKTNIAAITRNTVPLKELDLKQSALRSALKISSRFPYFVKKLGSANLHGRDVRLELPHPFVKDHGDKFQSRVILLGPSGNVRLVNLKVSSRCGKDKVQFRQGWRAFILEHGLKEGDVLLVTLVGLSKFIVQMFPAESTE